MVVVGRLCVALNAVNRDKSRTTIQYLRSQGIVTDALSSVKTGHKQLRWCL